MPAANARSSSIGLVPDMVWRRAGAPPTDKVLAIAPPCAGSDSTPHATSRIASATSLQGWYVPECVPFEDILTSTLPGVDDVAETTRTPPTRGTKVHPPFVPSPIKNIDKGPKRLSSVSVIARSVAVESTSAVLFFASFNAISIASLNA